MITSEQVDFRSRARRKSASQPGTPAKRNSDRNFQDARKMRDISLIRRYVIALALLSTVTSPWGSLDAGMVITDAPISGYLNGASSSISTTGSVDTSLSYMNFGTTISAEYQASAETDGIKLFLASDNATFSGIRAGVDDTYTVSGSNVGDVINFNAILVLEGTSETLPRPNTDGDYFGHSHIDVSVAKSLFGASSEVIDAQFGKVNETHQLVVGSSDFRTVRDYQFVDFTGANRLETVIPMSVTIGEAFQLAFSVGIDHTGDIGTNMLNTAFVEFDLGPGYSISSAKGFGTQSDDLPTSTVPEPSSLMLLGLGAPALLAWRRKRKSLTPQSIA